MRSWLLCLLLMHHKTKGKADAVLAASLFHYKELEICELKDYLADKGISVRR